MRDLNLKFRLKNKLDSCAIGQLWIDPLDPFIASCPTANISNIIIAQLNYESNHHQSSMFKSQIDTAAFDLFILTWEGKCITRLDEKCFKPCARSDRNDRLPSSCVGAVRLIPCQRDLNNNILDLWTNWWGLLWGLLQ